MIIMIINDYYAKCCVCFLRHAGHGIFEVRNFDFSACCVHEGETSDGIGDFCSTVDLELKKPLSLSRPGVEPTLIASLEWCTAAAMLTTGIRSLTCSLAAQRFELN